MANTIFKPTPPAKHQAIYAQLLKDLTSGLLAIGSRLPSERELAIRNKVSVHTLRQALARLEQEGWIRKQPTVGSVICRPATPRQLETAILPASGMGGLLHLVLNAGEEDFSTLSQYYNGTPQTQADALFTARPRSPTYLNKLYGMLSDACTAAKRSLLSSHMDAAAFERGELPIALRQGMADGVLLDGYVDDIHVAMLQQRGVPTVVVGNRHLNVLANQVCFEVEQVGYEITKAYLDAGIQRVLFVTSPFHFNTDRQQFIGYSRACREAGVRKDCCVLGFAATDSAELEERLENAKNRGSLAVYMNYDCAFELTAIYQRLGLDFASSPAVGWDPVIGDPAALNQISSLSADQPLAAAIAVRQLDALCRCPDTPPAVTTILPRIQFDAATRKITLAWVYGDAQPQEEPQ